MFKDGPLLAHFSHTNAYVTATGSAVNTTPLDRSTVRQFYSDLSFKKVVKP
jgi:hypothetical protein